MAERSGRHSFLFSVAEHTVKDHAISNLLVQLSKKSGIHYGDLEMKRMSRFRWMHLAMFLLVVQSCRLAVAVKSLKLGIAKQQPIIIEIPPSQWSVKETSWSSAIPISVLRADNNFIAARHWEDGTVPLLTAFYIEKAQDCGSGVMSGRIVGCPPNWRQLELRSPKAWLKLQFPPDVADIDAALKEFAYLGSVAEFEATDYLRTKVFMPNQAKLFEALPDLNADDRYALFKVGILNGYNISSTVFKSIGYVKVVVPASDTYNTLRMTQDQRVSEVIRETILPKAKTMLADVDGKAVGGLAFDLSIPAYNFVTGGESKFDDLFVYLQMDELRKFATSDITSRKLIDDSVVLLNGDRIEAKL